MKCDVLVVGAGPAGSMATKTIAEKGFNVILIERNKNIGFPVRCAEAINKYLFRDTGIKKHNSFIKQKIDGTKIHFYEEIHTLTSEQWQGYTIDRKIFDKYLANQAKNVGAEIVTATKAIGMKKHTDKWIVKTKSLVGLTNIETKIVIGADGFECNIGQYAGIRGKWRENEVSKGQNLEIVGMSLAEENFWHVAFGEEFPQGYGWVFPKGKKRANVGVAVSPNTNIKRTLDFFILKYPYINQMIGDKYKIVEVRGGLIPTCGPKNLDEIVGDGVILVGDAAGMVDPITGEGIYPSMISGISAGETAALCIEKNNWDKKELSEYQQRWMSKKYIDTTMGENMSSLIDLKETFHTILSNRKITKRKQKEFISMISNLT